MSAKLQLTIACGDYEIIRPLKEGTVSPDGIDLVFLTQMDSNTRHHRFMQGREFDIAELSASTYLVARGMDQKFMSLPVFLHRRFRHGMVYVNTSKGIRTPGDLQGRRVGLKSWTNTATLWMRGILDSEYGVDLTSIDWTTDLDEHVDGFEASSKFRVTRVPDNKSVEDMLASGEIDALLHPDIRASPACLPTPRPSRSPTSGRPASSRSCTSPPSSRRSSTATHGSRTV
jgi:4,5-dihydroxyphthalate decarboxylase